MNIPNIRPFIAPALLIGGGATAAVLGGHSSKVEAAKVAADSRAGRTPDLAPMYKSFGLAGVGIAAASAGMMLATRGAGGSGLSSMLHLLGFAGSAVGGGVALVGLSALALDHGTHGAPQAPGARGAASTTA